IASAASIVVMDSSKVETAEKPSGSVDHPCVERLRHRRLLAFLRDQGFHGAYAEVTRKTGVHMSLRHLRGLVERGRWADAIAYLELHL
uniref:LisH domain-containing protein n=1 Tax=Aegilops tauschii subsp. strangulata TaxID=200361 RepID=A0A453CZ83_AEGTS